MRLWSRLQQWFDPTPRPPSSRLAMAPVRPILERLEDRLVPAITTSFKASTSELIIRGDQRNNFINVRRSPSGFVLVNEVRVPHAGGFLKASRVKHILVNGFAGADVILVGSTRVGLPRATIIGGPGNDFLSGGFASDVLIGGAGNDNLGGGFGSDVLYGDDGDDYLKGFLGSDVLFGGPGEDILQGDAGNDHLIGDAGRDSMFWQHGEGDDFVEGGADDDTLHMRGATGASDDFTIGTNGNRVFVRNGLGPEFLDIGTTETLQLSAQGGGDSVTVHDLSGTDVRSVSISFGSDGAADAVTIDGTGAMDNIQAVGFTGAIVINGLAARIAISNLQAGNDRLTINGLGGDDVLHSHALADEVRLTLDGGDNDDTIVGDNGSETLIGGAGNDTFFWSPGGARDIVEGGAGVDHLRFRGSADAEVFTASSDGGRIIFQRNIDNIVLDLDDVEAFTLTALGGGDQINVNDLSGTDLGALNIDLSLAGVGVVGGSDGAADAITINGTLAADTMTVSGSAGAVTVVISSVSITMTDAESAIDTLTINTFSGADQVDASALANNSVTLAVNGGNDPDILIGSQGNDTIDGDAGDDVIQGGDGDDTLDGGADSDTIDGGNGTDTAANGEFVSNVP